MKVKELLKMKSKYSNMLIELKKIKMEIRETAMPVFENMKDVEKYKLNEQRKQIAFFNIESNEIQMIKDIKTVEKEIIENFPIDCAWIRIYGDVYAAVLTINLDRPERRLLISEVKDKTSLEILHKQIFIL